MEKWTEINENEHFLFFFGDPNKKLRVGADSGDPVGRPETDLFFYLALMLNNCNPKQSLHNYKLPTHKLQHKTSIKTQVNERQMFAYF